MNWQLLLFISVTTASISVLLQRSLLKEEKSDPFAYAIAFGATVSVLTFLHALFRGFSLSGLEQLIPNLVIMTLLYSFYNVIIFKAYKIIEASEATILFASRSIWTIVIAGIFLSEIITIEKILGTFIILSGVTAISWKKKRIRLNTGHLLALLAAMLFGTSFANDAYILSHGIDVPSYLTWQLDFYYPQ